MEIIKEINRMQRVLGHSEIEKRIDSIDKRVWLQCSK